MTYKFKYKNAELFASKMSTYGYRLFIMIDIVSLIDGKQQI